MLEQKNSSSFRSVKAILHKVSKSHGRVSPLAAVTLESSNRDVAY